MYPHFIRRSINGTGGEIIGQVSLRRVALSRPTTLSDDPKLRLARADRSHDGPTISAHRRYDGLRHGAVGVPMIEGPWARKSARVNCSPAVVLRIEIGKSAARTPESVRKDQSQALSKRHAPRYVGARKSGAHGTV